MNESKIAFEDFEQLLQKQSFRKSALYNNVLNSNDQTFKPQDVIETVYSQMKAIHSADSSKRFTSGIKDLYKVQKSSFLPINKLPVYHEVPKPNQNQFETQCVLDTQLLNIIDGAEAIATHTGITQEFNTTFTHIEKKYCDNAKPEENNEKGQKCSTLKFNNHEETLDLHENINNIKSGKINKEIVDTENLTKIENISDNVEDQNIQNPIEVSNTIPAEVLLSDQTFTEPDIHTHLSKIAIEDVITFIKNVENTPEAKELKEIQNNSAIMDIDTRHDTRGSPSPVLNTKARKRKLKKPSPLVVSLESFEIFENMAMSLIEENINLDTAKHLINSQILGKELCFNSNIDVMFAKRKNSPVLELKSDELQMNSQDLKKPRVKQILDHVVSLHNIETVTEKRANSPKDEIMFSSDEESEYINKELQDLPMTCALETSLYEESDVLEKTMYVGFQTASNKSIQICTDSFDKAKSILTDKDEKDKNFSLIELVEKCDTLNSKLEKRVESTTMTLTNAVESKLDSITDKKITGEISLKRQVCNGFITASCKEIKMDNEALERCQKVFKDIDLNKNFNAIEDSVNVGYAVDIKTSINENGKKEDIGQNMENNIIDDKINDEILLQEFENIEMSLEVKEPNNEGKKDVAFEGFKTANNKRIKISSEGMAKTMHIFQDIDVELDKQENEVNAVMKYPVENISTCFMNSCIGGENVIELKSASYKNINESPQEFAKTESNFQHIEINNEVVARDINHLSTSERVFVGFKTANNKEIKISDEALFKSKNIFKEINKENPEIETIEYIDLLSTSKVLFAGFKTASNKDINISDGALYKSKIIFKNIDKEDFKRKAIENIKDPSTSKVNNKDIKFADDTLLKSKNIFNYLDKEMSTRAIKEEREPTFKGFKAASNKNAKISKQKFVKSRKLFEDIDIDDNVQQIEETSINENPKEGLESFRPANNKPVKLSAEALLKENYFFADVDVQTLDGKISPCFGNKYENLLFKGFQTASKKAVIVSADALAKSKRIFEDIDKDDEIIAKNVSRNIEINKVNQTFKGFQTASEKAVTVSADASAKSKRIFKDIDEEDDEIIPEKIPKNISSVGFQGFETANSKPIEVNKEAVTTNKKLLSDWNDKQMENSRSNFIGFKTASNKNVNVSEEALAKSKKLFDDFEDKPITAQIPFISAEYKLKENIFNGFQTANNKEVKVSKDALEKTKNLFDDIESSTKNETKSPIVGFQTANNKKVTVSKQSLAKSKHLFHNIDTENDKNSTAYGKDTERFEANNATKDMLGFKNGNNQNITISKDAFKKSFKFFAEETITNKGKHDLTPEKYISHGIKKNTSMTIEGILNTQVLNNFEEILCTEDFRDTPRPNKRSGSPILSCPRAKKRKKFETPYKSSPKTITDFNKDIDEAKKTVNVITFNENYKKNKKHTLQDLAKLENANNKTIDSYILDFNLENVLDFEFDGVRNDLKEGKINIEELKQFFTEATDEKLIPDGWMDIQLKLILWKLISYEVNFPNTLGIVCTVRNVIDQLKFRYDRELYHAERPVLRKILEKDDVSTKAMVLCVAGFFLDGVRVTSVANLTNIELQLTDGWYFIKATIDKMLSKLVYDGKIVVGCKILTCGAELVNCDQGVAPWEDTSSIRLNIYGNSTKPARWWSRLGLHSGAMLCRLSDVKVDGGKTARLRLRVARVYPPLYVEKLEDGSTVTRSERLEHQYQMKYEAEREVMIEKIYEDVEKEFSDQESQESEGSLRNYDSGSQIAQLMKKSKDPMEFRAQLRPTQVQLLQDHVSKQRDKYLQAVQDRIRDTLRPRSVVTLARGRVAALDRDDGRVTVTKGMLSIWKPNDAVLDIFKENTWIEVTNVVPTAVRNSEIQLSAGRQSVFRQIKCNEEQINKPYIESLKRICSTIKKLSQNPSTTTDYNEIDTVGIIFSIDPPNRDFELNKNQFQNVYLADIDKNMICVNFWGGIKKFGYENVLDTGQVIYCGNLQKRAGNTRKNIPQYRATEFSLFTKTPKNEKARETVDEMNKKMYGLDRRKLCEDCMAVKQNYSVIKCFNDSENVSPYRFNNSDYNLGRNKMFIVTPVGVKVNQGKTEDFSLTGLDFESTFKQEDTQDLSPKTLLRKKKIDEKIAKLKMYGEPPPLSSINIINKSKNAANSYKSPLISKCNNVDTPKQASATNVNKLQNVATPINLPEVNAKSGLGNGLNLGSPIISMNRTFVKRSSVNPVKLNFSENAAIDENANSTVDHFAEDFDGSPPLSLD